MKIIYRERLRSTIIKIYEEILRCRKYLVLKKSPMTFITMIMLMQHFLSMFISSRCKKRYVLLWTDKAVLLVLWTCGDVELNPGPNKTTKRSARSQILREFRRSSQTILLKMMYKTCNCIFPRKPYKEVPPGWKENEPDIEFENISNFRSGDDRLSEDKIFSKMIWLLRNKSPVPLSSEWDVLLRHYDNLNTKLEQEESKKALKRWMYEKKLSPLLQEYSENVDIPSVEIQDLCLAILLKAPNMDQPDVLDSKKFDDKGLKTEPNGYAGFRQTGGETPDVEMLPFESFNNKERPESDTDISACSHSLNQPCAENQSVDVPHRKRRKRRRTEECTSAADTKIIKGGKKDLVQSQEMFTENHDGDTQNTTDDQCMQTCLENVDPTTLPCNKQFVESDHDCAQQISLSKDNCREFIDKETLPSNNLSGEEKHAVKLHPNSDLNQCTDNINIHGDELDGDQAENPPSEFLDEMIDKETLPSNNLSGEEKNANESSSNSDMNQCTDTSYICSDELDGDQAENLPREFLDKETLDAIYLELYKSDVLIMYLKKYSEDLADGRPSSRIVELCKNIVHKEHGSNACNTDACTN